MATTFALIRDLFAHVGPGVVLAFALPVFIGMLGVIIITGFKRFRSVEEEA